MGCAVLGFLGLRAAQGPTAPWRAFRLSLGVGLALACYLLVGLPWPPRERGELASALCLAGGGVGSLAAMLGAPSVPRVTLALAGLLGGYGALMTANFVRTLELTYAGTPSAPLVLSYLLATCLGASWVAALGHLLWSRRDLRGGVDPRVT
jgi:hypothetical protein